MNAKLLVIAATLVASGVTVGAASADIDGCTGTQTCLWDDANFQGKLASRTQGEATIKNLSASADNKTEAWANNSNTYKTCAWNGPNGTGDEDGSWHENTSNENLAPWNADVMSSWRTKWGC
jgi:Peptidase inhibitor family I36